MTTNELAQLIYSKYGIVTRARGCFLYTRKGRLTDLFQEKGRAVLGWDGKNSFTYFKNFLSKSQVGSFICEDKSRVVKAVSKLLDSERKVFFYTNKIDAVKAAADYSQNSISVYKPWTVDKEQYKNQKAVIIVPPLPWTDTVYILAVLPDCNNISGNIQIPFALQAAISRSIYNLISEIETRQEKDWFIYDTVLTKYWTRKGPYLFPKLPKEQYDDFVIHCLNLGIIINPNYDNCSIVPFGADKGVFTILKNNPFNFQA